MGTKFEVHAWMPDPAVPDGYAYVQIYGGGNPIKTLWAAARAKRTAGCVRIEWRG